MTAALTPWQRRIPLLAAVRDSNRASFVSDSLAGLTTAVMLVPQAMAYALLAGLPPVIGLYAALVPPLIYAFIGTSRQLSVGPVAMDSLLVAAGVGAIAETGTDAYLTAAITLAMMAGVIQVILGAFRLGFVVNFLSLPVISGFTSGAAILIGLSQLKHFLGVPLQGASNALSTLSQLPAHADHIQLETVGLGVVAVGLLVLMKKKAKKLPAPLLVVSLGAAAVAGLGLEGRVAIVGDVPEGLPAFDPSRIDLGLLGTLLPTALTIALVAFMESIAVSKAYARQNKYVVDPNRELVAIGAANVAGAMFSGYPVTGGFSRTAVNAAAGAKTQVAGLITVLFVALSLLFLTPLFYYLPKVALAAIIMVAVSGLVDFREVRRLSKIKRSDMALLSLTLVATLALGIVPGVGVGVAASVLWLVVQTTRPHLAVLGRIRGTTQFRNVQRHEDLITYRGVLIVRMDARFYFGNVAFFKDALGELEREMEEKLVALVLDASAINGIDSSGEAAFRELMEDYRSRDVQFIMAGLKGPVLDVIRSSGLAAELGQSGSCLSVHQALATLNPEPRVPRACDGTPTRPSQGSGSASSTVGQSDSENSAERTAQDTSRRSASL